MHWTKDTISEAQAQTLYGLFCERVRRTPEDLAYQQFDRCTGLWQRFTWRALAAQVARWQEALVREGLQSGERVAVSLRNGVDWVAFDQAALGLGLVVVPLYADDRPDNVAYILEDVGASLLLVQDGLRWRRLEQACYDVSAVRRVVVWETDDNERFTDGRVRAARDWLPQGEFQPRTSHVVPNDLATVVYTSGTTGRPKGVMLSHHNILAVVEAGLQVVDVYCEDLFLSFLPLSHMFERTVGYYLPMAAGAGVAYARSAANLADDLALHRPTVLIAVPRIFERMYDRIMDQLEKAPVHRRVLFRMAVGAGWGHFEHRQRRRAWSPASLFWPLFDALVGRRVRARLGGRLRLVVSGGAALPPSIAQVFIGLGLPVLKGYGLTETSPQVSVNRVDDSDPASVGRPLPGVEICIGENDELLVRGPGNMRGYWNAPDATAAMIRDGWLYTGDQACVRDGRIYITGRIKDVLVLSNGEKVPPGEMELAIVLEPLIEQVMIVGEARAFLSALVVFNQERWLALAKQLGLDPAQPESLADRHVQQEILSRIRRRLHGFPTWAKVRRVLLSLEPWTVDNGLLTPTLKTKRAAVLARFREPLEQLYHHGHGD